MEQVYHRYLPHSDQDIKEMLQAIGLKSLDELFKDIPENIRQKRPLNIPDALSEYEVYKKLKCFADKNNVLTSFCGFGSYDHIIPSVVKHLMGRSEFYTAYTPYQPEISQGILQAIFEFQTLICQITGLDVSNASLYDGHTAACEAAVMAVNSKKKAATFLYSSTIHPNTKEVLKTYFSDQDVILTEIPEKDGVISKQDFEKMLTDDVSGVLVQSPNVYGFLEDYSGYADVIHAKKANFIISANPMALAQVKSPAEWGADMAIGDTQVFGLSTYFGGPSVGYLAATEKLLRKMPGRIVGETLDIDGKRGYVLTLQAREQHIKRERATSNICSNQALAALGTTIYLSELGKEGAKNVALQNFSKAGYLFKRLTKELKLEALSTAAFFNEFTVKLPKNAEDVLNHLRQRGFLGGVALKSYISGSEELLTIAVTEKRTKEEIDKFFAALQEALA